MAMSVKLRTLWSRYSFCHQYTAGKSDLEKNFLRSKTTGRPLLAFGWDMQKEDWDFFFNLFSFSFFFPSFTLSLSYYGYQQSYFYMVEVIIVFHLLRHIWLFVTPWTAVWQPFLSFSVSQSLLKIMFIELEMLSDYLILCHPLLLLSVLPNLRVFSNELALRIRWPKYWSLNFKYSGLISFRIDWFDLFTCLSAENSRVTFSKRLPYPSPSAVQDNPPKKEDYCAIYFA